MKVFSKEKYLKSMKEGGLSKVAKAMEWWRELDGIKCEPTGGKIAGHEIYICRGKIIIDKWIEEAER